jgi:hypothetical protein
MKLVITGVGYVGLVTAVCMAEKGHVVTCVDINKNKVDLLNKGISPFFEQSLEDLMKKNSDRLIFTSDHNIAYIDADVIFIGVGTPEKRDGSANLSDVYRAAKKIAKTVNKNCIVVVKSTVPVGTKDKIEFEYPVSKEKSWDNFTYEYYFRGGGEANSGLDLNYLVFKNEGYEYRVYQEYSSEEKATIIGVKVTELSTGKETDIKGESNSLIGNLYYIKYTYEKYIKIKSL